MNTKNMTFQRVFLAFVLSTMTAALGDPGAAFAQTPPPEGSAATPLPPAPPPPAPYAAQPAPQSYAAPVPFPPGEITDPEYNKRYPKKLPYDDGPIPPGYRLATSRHLPLIIAGSATFAGFYSFAIVGTLLTAKPQYAIPIVGPLLAIDRVSNDPLEALANGVGNFFFAFDALGQAAGLGLLIAGIPQRTYLLRNDVVAFKPQITIGPGSVQMQMHF